MNTPNTPIKTGIAIAYTAVSKSKNIGPKRPNISSAAIAASDIIININPTTLSDAIFFSPIIVNVNY